MNKLIETIDLTKVYGEKETSVTALNSITTAFNENQFTAIMGPSGSGKSTLLHCLAGLDKVTSGSILINGIDLASLNDKELTKMRRDSFGFVFQAFNLIPTLTAEENITLPSSIAGRKPEDEWVEQVINAMDIGDRLGIDLTNCLVGNNKELQQQELWHQNPKLYLQTSHLGILIQRQVKSYLFL